MSLGGHFGFWTDNGPKWPPQKCQDDFLAISVSNLCQNSHWQELHKISHDGLIGDIRTCT